MKIFKFKYSDRKFFHLLPIFSFFKKDCGIFIERELYFGWLDFTFIIYLPDEEIID